ncbi:MAG: shikimate kinase [Clostridia bacterium]|nr:shikimate kinase [Clostridia bacterium]
MKKFGLLGRRLSHSLSPQIHAYFGDYPYELIEREPDALAGLFADGLYQGFNVTIPYKTAIIPYCDELDALSARMGSVNTVYFKNGKTVGYNTDYFGFRYLLEQNGISVSGCKVLVLGSGGASLTVRAVLGDLQVGEIVVISRSGKDNYENISQHYDADMIVNTTPVGMYPNNLQSPIELQEFKNCRTVVDLIYNPLRTKLLLDAERLGMRSVNGLTMLVAQAKRAAELFTGTDISNNEIKKTVAAMQQEFCSLVLVGMPGCGKSTVGKRLAEYSGKIFMDTDDMVVSATGTDIPTLFATQGEAVFRKLETDAVLQATKQLGAVIATGGGVVLKEINCLALRQNAKVVFLSRPVDELATAGRPLSKDRKAVCELLAQRLPLYRAVSDFEVAVDKNPEVTCKKILEAIKNEDFSD